MNYAMSSEHSRSSEYLPTNHSTSEDKSRRSCLIRNNDKVHGEANSIAIPETKCIHIYINGNEHFSGCRCVVNSRYYRNLDMLLNYLTERLQPSFGAVRNIYTPVNGHSIQNLDDLISRQKYVVAGNERFKKLDFGYQDPESKKNRKHILKSKNKGAKSKLHNYNALTINLYQNGNFKMKPRKISFISQDLDNWESIYRKISETLKCGPVKRICSLTGMPMQAIDQLINNHTYVVIGKHEVFKIGNYGNIAFKKTSAKDKHINYQPSQKSVITTRSSAALSRSSAQSLALSRSLSSQMSNKEIFTYKKEKKNIVNSELFNQSDYVDEHDYISSFERLLHSNSAKTDFVNKINLDLDTDLGGIFRSKMQNVHTVGAAEIEDSHETVVELPVDLIEAEEIEDEVTPDMERSLQHLSLDVSEEIVAFLPTMPTKASEDSTLSNNKYNLPHSQNLDSCDIYV